ncbi:MAG: lipocalin family protein [Bacteroidota bacterium]
MKKYIVLLFYITALAFSCSEDNNTNDMLEGTDGLVGTWFLTDIRIDEGTNDDDLNFAKQILGFLQGIDCELIIFTFNESGTLDTDSKIDHLSINVGTGGLDIPCPTEIDEESALWVLNGDQLTISKEGEADEVFTIELDGNTLIVPGESVDANNYAGADAVFTRQ